MANRKMKKILFFTNMPSPYRVEFFNQLGKRCDLHVIFELNDAESRDKSWFSRSFKSFVPHFLKSHSYSEEGSFSFRVIREYQKISPDVAVVCDISSLSGIALLSYLIRHKRPYIIEGDGAFNRPSNFLKAKIKSRFFRHAQKLLYTSDEHKRYYLRFGANAEKLLWYPFSSIREDTILNDDDIIQIKGKKDDDSPFVFLSAGRFLDWKNFETAIRAFGKAKIPNSRFVLIGGEPKKEYLDIVKAEKIPSVDFLPFMSPESLFSMMQTSDCFVFPSLNDIWGLVINEAAANGLPILASRTTLSAPEIAKTTKGIVLFDGKNEEDLARKMREIASLSKEDRIRMGIANAHAIRSYTIESMVQAHFKLFDL